jgi:hypothetical protein
MKKTIAAILLLTSSLSFAQDLSVEEYFKLFEANKEAYEKVEPGMTAEYSETFISESEGVKVECLNHEKTVVISKDHLDKYLVYRKRTLLNDCNGEMKGTVEEKLVWEEHYKVEGSEINLGEGVEIKKINRDGDIIKVQGSQKDEDGMIYEYETTLDLSKSQFYNLIEDKFGDFKTKLLRRGYTDPSSINIENLEIIEHI